MESYYFIRIWGCVVAELYGPYPTPEIRDKYAIRLVKKEGVDKHCFAKLTLYGENNTNPKASISSFVSGELGEE